MLILFSAFSSISSASSDIVAIVNDTPITKYDFEERKKLITFLFNIDPTQKESEKQLNSNVLNTLIENVILSKHLEKTGGKVQDQEVKDTINMIEQQNQMKPGELIKKIKERNIDQDALYDQINQD